jgi:hypothetical protein
MHTILAEHGQHIELSQHRHGSKNKTAVQFQSTRYVKTPVSRSVKEKPSPVTLGLRLTLKDPWSTYTASAERSAIPPFVLVHL